MKKVLFITMLAVFLGTCFIPNVNARKIKVEPGDTLVFSDDDSRKMKREIERQKKEIKKIKRNKILKDFGLPTFID